MRARNAITIAALLFALLTTAVWFVVPKVSPPARTHGEFASRFQPDASLAAHSAVKVDQERRASIGSVKQLRPVEIARE